MNCSCDTVNIGVVACTPSGQIEHQIACDHKTDLPIIIKGVCEPDEIENMLEAGENIWTQLFIPEVLCIPHQKPDIEQLLSINARVEIISQKVIRTPVLRDNSNEYAIPNQEGIITTGRKLVVEGILRQKVMYTAANEEQSVHATHFDVPFSAFMILDVGTLLSTRYKIDTCIEDIFICGCTERQIFKNVTLFIKATPIVCD